MKALSAALKTLEFVKKQLGVSTNPRMRHRGDRAFDSGTFLTIFNSVKSLVTYNIAMKGLEDEAKQLDADEAANAVAELSVKGALVNMGESRGPAST